MDPAERLKTALNDRYRIERELGGGGMSRVFLATETALGRTVVIKIVAPGLLEGAAAERFTREVKVAARLQQANIVPLLSAGEADGLAYYTMPFVDGLSLRARLTTGGPMPIAEATQILRDVAKALAYAHAQGVVHRDIKPENVLLSGGTAIVTDFGIAKALNASRTSEDSEGSLNFTAETLTSAGSSLGTPAYMAPEQAVGSPVDFRADLYSWGVMAWELLAGAHPFGGRTTAQQLVAAQIAERPMSLATKNPAVPKALADIVMQCLEKDPPARPASATDLLVALDSASTPEARLSVASPEPISTPRPMRLVAGLAVVAILVVAATFALKSRAGGTTASATNADSSISSIAVLPFVNTGGDPRDEYFGDGMTDELAHALSKIEGLRLAGRSSSYSFKGKSVPAKEIGTTLDVGAIIEGTVRRSGETLRVTAQLTSTRDGRVLWSDSFERAGNNVFAVQDAFTSAIVGALTPRLASTARLAALPSSGDTRGTADAEAYELYLRGRYFWAQRGAGPLDSAVSLFSRAVQRDPRFARAWAGLGLAHVMRTNYNALVHVPTAFDSSEAAARRALTIDSTVADAHASLGMTRLRQFDFKAAEASMAAARRLEPQNANAHHWSALLYAVMGDTARADQEFGIAINLDPVSATTLNSRATFWSDWRRFREALDAYRRVTELSPSFQVHLNSSRALIWLQLADSAFNSQQRRTGQTSVRGRLGGLIFAAAAAERWDEALRLRDVIRRGEDPTILLYDRAVAELIFGARAKAAELFVRSMETEGTVPNVIFTLCEPILDAVRDEPAYRRFLERHSLTDCPLRSPWPIKSPPPETRR